MIWLKRIGKVLGVLVALIALWLAVAALFYSPVYVGRILAWGESDTGDYLNNFPLSSLSPSPTVFYFETSLEEERVRSVFEPALGVSDLDTFLAESETEAFIVIHEDNILYEGYFNGAARDSMVTSFSVAKSFDSALIGVAIDEGFISSVNDPVTDYLPELGERDDRFETITIRDLLRMAAGLDYKELRWALFNGDDPLTTYYPDQREIALDNTNIVDPPAQYFLYNKYHPQLLGLILERTTGMSVTEYTQTRLWDPLGMEFSGAWALDSEDSGFEKMEAGLNARAIDFAKFGRLFLEDGNWNGIQVVSSEWVDESTGLDTATHNSNYYANEFGQQIYAAGGGYYQYMWYGRLREGEQADFFAEGDHGQIIYVSPARRLIIIRNGTGFGIPGSEWIDAFYRAAGDL